MLSIFGKKVKSPEDKEIRDLLEKVQSNSISLSANIGELLSLLKKKNDPEFAKLIKELEK
mgnify:CR=1 FL=1